MCYASVDLLSELCIYATEVFHAPNDYRTLRSLNFECLDKATISADGNKISFEQQLLELTMNLT